VSSFLVATVLAVASGSFVWSAPDACPDEASLRARLPTNTSHVLATVVERDDGFELTVTIDGEARILTTPSCREAADTAVFLVELAGRKAASVRKVVAPLRGDEPPLLPFSEPAVPRLHLSALAGAEWLLLPLPVPRFGASLHVEFPAVTLTFDLRSAPPLRFGGVALATINITPAIDLQLGVCKLFKVGPARLGPCGQAGLGVVWAVGVNVPGPHERIVPVWTAGPALRFALPLGSTFELQAFAAARFGPRPVYFFEGLPPSVETSLLGLDTGLGVGARW
jgi:hypothetical protein